MVGDRYLERPYGSVGSERVTRQRIVRRHMIPARNSFVGIISISSNRYIAPHSLDPRAIINALGWRSIAPVRNSGIVCSAKGEGEIKCR